MAIRLKRVTTWKKEDVKYHFTDGNKIIHDSKKYYLNKVSPANEVSIRYGSSDNIQYKFKDRGSEPDSYTWSVTLGSGKAARTTWYTGSSLPRVYDRFSNSERTQWTEWNDKGDGTYHTKSPEKTEKYLKRERIAGRK